MNENPQATKTMSESKPLFDDWLYITGQQIDALLVFRSYLQAWQTHPLLGHIDPALFDIILAELERVGLAKVINSENTRSLRKVVTGVER